MSVKLLLARLIGYLSRRLSRARSHGESSDGSVLGGLTAGYVDEAGVPRPLL
jgi:hypothetical protein